MRRVAALLCLALVFACTERERAERTQFREAEAALARQLPGSTVTVEEINAGSILITVINSSFNDRPDEERKAQATRTSRAAVAMLTAHPPEEVRVVFASRTGIVTRNVADYPFIANVLRLPDETKR